MTVEVPSIPGVNPLALMLKDVGITNGRKLVKYTDSPAVIFFLVKGAQGGRNDPRAELHHGNQVEVFRPTMTGPDISMKTKRRTTVAAAERYAAEKLGLKIWHKTPFDNCWMPIEAIQRMRTELGIGLLAS